MRLHTRITYHLTDNGLVLIEDESFEYVGQVAHCKGASAAETAAANSQSSFASTLQNDFGTAFGEQQGILNNLTSQLTQTVNQGPSQFGFSPAEVNALNTQATTGTAQQYQNAKQAAGEASAAAGGGNTVIPTGATQQQQSAIAQAGAQQEANQLLGIQTAGWQQGQQNYQQALSGLLNTSSQLNPNALAGTASSTGSSAFNEQNTVSQENNAASPWNAIGGALGGIATTALNAAAPGVGSALGGLFKSTSSIPVDPGYYTAPQISNIGEPPSTGGLSLSGMGGYQAPNFGNINMPNVTNSGI